MTGQQSYSSQVREYGNILKLSDLEYPKHIFLITVCLCVGRKWGLSRKDWLRDWNHEDEDVVTGDKQA
jgi:hypothetical protein